MPRPAPDFKVDRFEHFSPEVQVALGRIAVHRRWKKSQVLLWGGDIPTNALVVMKGRLRLRTHGLDGTEHILGWLETGAVGALAPLLSQTGIAFDFVADQASEVLHLEYGRLMQLMASDGRVGLAIARVLAARLCVFVELHHVQTSPLAERVWIMLKRLALAQSEPDPQGRLALRITQEELAHAVGASRYRVGIEMRQLHAAGRIVLQRGKIQLLPAHG
ncbi:MAG: Crp/Fnr family transcriptional regulator [Burkholderiaceae bacterium]